jgi:hypothetical protein
MSCTTPQPYPISSFALGLNGPEGFTDEVKSALIIYYHGEQSFNRALKDIFIYRFHGYKDTTQYSDHRPQLRLSDSAACCVGKQGGRDYGCADTLIPARLAAGLSLVESRITKGQRAA